MTDTTIGGIATTATNLTLADLIEIEQGGVSKQAALGLLLGLLFDSDDTLVGDSDDVAPTQKAVKAFVENAIAAITTGGASIGVQFLADTGSTSDADPGAGNLRWNHIHDHAGRINSLATRHVKPNRFNRLPTLVHGSPFGKIYRGALREIGTRNFKYSLNGFLDCFAQF